LLAACKTFTPTRVSALYGAVLQLAFMWAARGRLQPDSNASKRA
jgi:hypothetical protein